MECHRIRKMKESRIFSFFVCYNISYGKNKIKNNPTKKSIRFVLMRWFLGSLEVPNGLCLLASGYNCHFPHCCDNIPRRGNFKAEGLALALSLQVYTFSWQGEYENELFGHIASTVKKQWKVEADTKLTFFILFNKRIE